MIVSKILPVKFNMRVLYVLSLLIALIVTIVSVIGIIYQKSIYPTEKLLNSFVPNDIVNLVAGLPLLLISLWLTLRGKLIGLLCWPGAIFYMLYVYFPYLICVPFNFLFLPYLILFSLCIYTIIGIITSIDGNAVSKYLSGVIPAKISGGILIGLSILIIIRQTGLMINALINKTLVEPQELALWIADFTIASPAMFIGGFFLWKKKPLGYVTGAGMGRLQETCGAVSGSYMVLGIYNCIKHSDNKERKEKTYTMIQRFADKFKAIHGTTDCKSLLNCDLKTEEGRDYAHDHNLYEIICEKCILDSIRIIEELIAE